MIKKTVNSTKTFEFTEVFETMFNQSGLSPMIPAGVPVCIIKEDRTIVYTLFGIKLYSVQQHIETIR